MKIIILTGNELRHQYFRKKMASDTRFEVLASYCEGTQRSLANRVAENNQSSDLEKRHVEARAQSEIDFFNLAVSTLQDESNPTLIDKGQINDDRIVAAIEAYEADVLVCFGSSLISSSLLKSYSGKFMNVHLGLSPFYRGSGTNIWPLIDKDPAMVGATFMQIDEGIDTGEITHQMRASIFLGDSPHTIGNRLIMKMTEVFCEIVVHFSELTKEPQPNCEGKLCLQKHFDARACATLYRNFDDGLIRHFIENSSGQILPYIIENKGLK